MKDRKLISGNAIFAALPTKQNEKCENQNSFIRD